MKLLFENYAHIDVLDKQGNKTLWRSIMFKDCEANVICCLIKRVENLNKANNNEVTTE